MIKLNEQEIISNDISRIFEIYSASDGEIRPHFIVTGESGSGKSYLIQNLSTKYNLDYIEINAAQLTKEGMSGNSLSKALSPLSNKNSKLIVCFVDEFDKLFISGNNNSSLAHESTNGVQNEFLKVLESENTSVFGDYGKYINVSVKHVLFVFAGAFNGEEEISIDRLRDFGVKTEFLGRVGLVFNTKRITLESMLSLVSQNKLLSTYLQIFPNVKKEDVVNKVRLFLKENYEKNTLGIRLINTLITQYFIKGGKLGNEEIKQTTFQKTLSL